MKITSHDMHKALMNKHKGLAINIHMGKPGAITKDMLPDTEDPSEQMKASGQTESGLAPEINDKAKDTAPADDGDLRAELLEKLLGEQSDHNNPDTLEGKANSKMKDDLAKIKAVKAAKQASHTKIA